jgi:hypothetical protein
MSGLLLPLPLMRVQSAPMPLVLLVQVQSGGMWLALLVRGQLMLVLVRPAPV